MKRLWTPLSCFLSLWFAGSAAAQTVPVKTIVIYNNSKTQTIYPVIQAPIRANDLWLQAHFNVPHAAGQPFGSTKLYKAYINRQKGVLPGQSVSIRVPFYTQLLPVTPVTNGDYPDQYIDWWNAMRVYLFDGVTAARAAFNYNNDSAGKTIPPTPVNPLAGAQIPTCAPNNAFNCEAPTLVSYGVGYPWPIPAQLLEYTFAAANGPPLQPKFSIDYRIVNFNISGVDSVYMPAAMGVLGNANVQYLGTVQAADDFRAQLAVFADAGNKWPIFVPAYYTAQNPQTPLPSPPAGVQPYPQPQVPSANFVLAESYRRPTPAPPVLTSNVNGVTKLGTVAQRMVTLWNKCTSSTTNTSKTCVKLRNVYAFFKRNYTETCGLPLPLPPTWSLMRDVYGWVEFPNCPQGPQYNLAATPGYKAAFADYCDLQYNYLDPTTPQLDIFNPYVPLLHQTIQTNAYAFSVDDGIAFKSAPGTGLVITVGGPKGLPNQTQTPLPTLQTYKASCNG
ncbi:hypothetical protein [Methylocystis sp. ATCC 49242]|uniref:hypothetical protein n=1 Tax=Methylocystis sp. ATCC 49242 TaxID=622637 RepID=UPI0001F88847|nr:hypothetical protein [Methylocystis sp. ATCC 49242]